MRVSNKTIVCGLVLLQRLATAFKCSNSAGIPDIFRECSSTEAYLNRCFQTGICYGDTIVEEGRTRPFCCEELDEFCKSTKMHTYRDISPNYHIKRSMWDKNMDSKWFYKDSSTLAGCPIPYSYDTIYYRHQTPINFTISRTEPLPNCKTNADCAHDEYCGQAYNAAYDRIDHSDNGHPRMFCYKKQRFFTPPFYLVPNKRDIGLPVCSNQYQCYRSSFCYTLLEKRVLYAAGRIIGRGLCAEAKICEVKNTVNSNGIRLSYHNETTGEPIDGFCERDEDCKRNKEFNSVLYIPHCTPAGIPDNNTVKLCCYEKQPSCDYGYRLPGDIKCNTTADCNEGKNMEFWFNWCDRTGVCCSVPNNETFRCPDRYTFLFAEEPCIDVNISDPTSGKCPISDVALCKYGHCCPDTREVRNEDGDIERVITSNTTYISNNWCEPGEMPRDEYYNAYCDLNRETIIIVSTSEAEKARDKECLRASDCEDGEICMRLSKTINKCFMPLKLPTTTTELVTTTTSSSATIDSSNNKSLNLSPSHSYSSSYASLKFSVISKIIIGCYVLISIISYY